MEKRPLRQGTGTSRRLRTRRHTRAGRWGARGAAALLPAALVAGLLGNAAPASAATDENGVPVLTDREQAVNLWQYGGVGIKTAAEQALLGSSDDVKKFLADAPAIENVDDEVTVSRIFNAGGRRNGTQRRRRWPVPRISCTRS